MGKLRDRLRLPLEPLPSLSAFGQMPRQDFDRDRAFQTRVSRLVYLPHPSGSERREDFVRSETAACRDHVSSQFSIHNSSSPIPPAPREARISYGPGGSPLRRSSL